MSESARNRNVLFFCIVFLVIFGLNVLPAFAPSTWSAISYISIRYGANSLALALVGAVGAACGRAVLAKLSRLVIRQKFLSEKTKRNIDAVRTNLEARKVLTAGMFLFYAASPLPSNNLFIAYGLTTMSLRLITFPFFLGRLVTYLFWAFSAEGLVRILGFDTTEGRVVLSYYFVAAQIVSLLMVVVFTKIDWDHLFMKKRLRWFR